jgi:hypothetical protein
MIAIPIGLVLIGILFAVGNGWIILRSKQRDLERRIECIEKPTTKREPKP